MEEKRNLTMGGKICSLRKMKNMTQADLGCQLNVSYQAVSKWERDESLPDFDTMTRIAQIFNVPLSYFSNDSEITIEEALAKSSTNTAVLEKKDEPKMLGVCKDCGRTVYENNKGLKEKKIIEVVERYGRTRTQRTVEKVDDSSINDLVCRACGEKRARQMKIRQEKLEIAEIEKRARIEKCKNRGLIFGGITSIILLVLGILGMVKNSEKIGPLIGVTLVLVVIGFTFVSQLFWDGAVADCCFFGGKIIGTPGIIFDLSLDGFIFLIAMKIIFAILRFIVYIITLLFFVLIAMIISPFTFIPALKRVLSGDID